MRGLPRHDRLARPDHQPTHLVACWDNDWRPAFRVDADPHLQGAPAGRRARRRGGGARALDPAGADHRDALQALGIPRLGADGYEADDVIGTLADPAQGRCRSTSSPATATCSSSSTTPRTSASSTRHVAASATPTSSTRPSCTTKYGVANGPAYADMAVLRGDTSDGLPGVAGIGEKTAAKLIKKYGTLAALRAAVDSGDPAIKGAQRARLEAGAAYLDVAPKVVQVAPRRRRWTTSTWRCRRRWPTRC